VRAALIADGVDVRERVEVQAVAPGPTLVLQTGGEIEQIRGSHLLVATGRRPNVEGLGLAEAGVAFDRSGIHVDAGLRTTNRKIFAIGDVTGGPQFTHAASFQAGIVLRRALLRLPAKATTSAMPRVTYTDPELAWVGEERATVAADGRLIEVLDVPFAHIDRAHCEGRSDGRLRLLLGKRRKLLGVGIVGVHAGELLMPWCLALGRGLPLSALAATIVPYPTRSEISKKAAGAAYEAVVFGPWLRRLVRLLSRFG
jgi:pyruvate/2-oxoglutarate dehydrogenase complex dihydrolipoamide dehydrogenase (E3) component